MANDKPSIRLRALSESILDTAGTGDPLPDPIKSYYPRPVESQTIFRTTLHFWSARAFALEQRIAELENALENSASQLG